MTSIVYKASLVIVFCLLSLQSFSWGFYAHKKINELAVFSLPPEMFGFYKLNIEFLSNHAPDPDKRRYAVAEEGIRHFMDADRYEKAVPFDTIPRNWKDAVAKYTEDTLKQYGIIPWHLELMINRLTYAFKGKEFYKIIRLSTDIGHYVGDLNVPLHTTANYNGQLSNQHGIHALWESRLPELFASDYDFWVGKANYVEDINNTIWEHFEYSYSLVDSILSIERGTSLQFNEEKKYTFEQRGATTVRVYSQTFSKAFHTELAPMVENQMRRAIKLLADLWFTAWVNAGQPDIISEKQKVELNESDILELQNIDIQYNKRKIIGRPEPNE